MCKIIRYYAFISKSLNIKNNDRKYYYCAVFHSDQFYLPDISISKAILFVVNLATLRNRACNFIQIHNNKGFIFLFLLYSGYCFMDCVFPWIYSNFPNYVYLYNIISYTRFITQHPIPYLSFNTVWFWHFSYVDYSYTI